MLPNWSPGVQSGGTSGKSVNFESGALSFEEPKDFRMPVIRRDVLEQKYPISTPVISRQDQILNKRAVSLVIELIGLVPISVSCWTEFHNPEDLPGVAPATEANFPPLGLQGTQV